MTNKEMRDLDAIKNAIILIDEILNQYDPEELNSVRAYKNIAWRLIKLASKQSVKIAIAIRAVFESGSLNMWHLNNDPYLECPWFGHLVPEEVLPCMAEAKKRFNKKLPIRFNIDEGWEGILK